MNDHQPHHYAKTVDESGEYTHIGGHPVPRIEIVERIGGVTRRHVDKPVAKWIEEPDSQPWHVRYIGGNGEPLATSEQLTSRDAAETNALALADLFGHPTATLEPSAFAESGGMFLDYGPTVPVVYVREGDAS